MSELWLVTLRPVLADLALPPVPLILALLAAWPLLVRKPLAGRAVVVMTAVALWLSSCLGPAELASQLLLRQYPHLSPQRMEALRQDAEMHHRSGIVALGSGIQQYAPEYGGPKLTGESLERLRYAIWLGRELKLPVGFSGGLGWAAQEGTAEATAAQAVATQEFKAPLRWVEISSRDTRQNASETVALLRAAGVQRIIVVTSAVHMPRAMAAFKEASEGTAMVFEPAPLGVNSGSRRQIFNWIPSEEGIALMRLVVREWLWALGGA